MNLNWIYTGISWILLRWHDLWGGLLNLPSGLAWVLSIVFLVLTVRVVLFPVFVKQIKSQRAMQALQPQMKELRDKYKNDQQKLQQEMMELYRREKANPLMGCLPIFLQIPVFLGLFHVLRLINPASESAFKAMTTEYGWTEEQFHSASEATIFGAPIAAAFRNTTEQLEQLDASRLSVTLVSGILIITMVATTYITQRQMIARNGAAADPTQAMVQKLMLYGIPASLLISGAIFPIGVVIYWVTQNFFSMGQQFWVLSKMPIPKPGDPKVDPEKAAAMAPKPGVKPVNPKKGGRSATARQSTGGSVKFDTAQARADRAAADKSKSDASADDNSEKPAPARRPTPPRGSGGGRRPQDNRNRKRKGGRR
ncbi:membrane protein insertase YidC [Cryptosporangium aurantiacum]|uniref:Membrane protein insertase YidC n=1 Tax=Cryptosporangium aurantiacum TaxID=134849 RepID=A0A1M7RL06_9ACTN|nr:membrane protein insertase YidC [Cryptosporangium aurantiacum]SHN46831.1 YidC/Oxa1 family membrane protein insertase [Cryptosporangium aurantiacum]